MNAMAILKKSINLLKKQPGRAKFTLIILFGIIVGAVFAAASVLILGIFHLAYRHWVVSVGAFLLLFSIIALLSGCIACLWLYKKRFARTLKIIGTAMLLGLTGLMLYWGGFISFWISIGIEEQVVERDGVKMLAQVDAFLDTFVRYYEYENGFVRGKYQRVAEWYGDGGFNPFKRDPMPEPITVTYYDETGRRIGDAAFTEEAVQKPAD
jgi:hypothetical protein